MEEVILKLFYTNFNVSTDECLFVLSPVCLVMHLSLTILTACDDGDPSATESTRRKAFNLDEISENKKFRHLVNQISCLIILFRRQEDKLIW